MFCSTCRSDPEAHGLGEPPCLSPHLSHDWVVNGCDLARRFQDRRGKCLRVCDTDDTLSVLGLSISDHMYRMAVLAMCTSDQQLDVSKYVYLCSLRVLAAKQNEVCDDVSSTRFGGQVHEIALPIIN